MRSLLLQMLFGGLPWTAWLLWFASIGIGLAIVLVFFFKNRGKAPPNERR